STTGMTLNWADSPDEQAYQVDMSTDGVVYSSFTTLASGAVTLPVTGLFAGTNYFWRVYAISSGAFSTPLAGSQMTATPGAVTSTPVGGLWSIPATWSGGMVPTSNDTVTIANGATVIIDTAALAYS